VTYYCNVCPNNAEGLTRYEVEVEAPNTMSAIIAAREIPGVLLVTNVREWTSPKYTRYPFA
jgi:hypothetical protein